MACHRCGAPVEPESFDLQCWVALDAREDGWALYVCPACQAAAERERLLLLLDR
jgi:hypothetical protein